MAQGAAEQVMHGAGPAPLSLRLAYSGGDPPALRRRPPVVPNGVLAMVIFLGTEIMLFAALISAYLILRAGTPLWPPADQPRLPVEVTGVNTLVLFASAVTMWLAMRAARDRRHADLVRWLARTAVLGATFLLVQGVEWIRLLAHGLHASSSVYGATFYTLIGFHAVHVLAAVITLGVLLVGTRRQPAGATVGSRVAVCRIYWLFVVAVWPVLYVLVYLT